MDFSKIKNYLFLGLLLLVSVVFLYLIAPFAYPLFWAAVVAALFFPVYERIDRLVRHSNLSTIITLVLVAVIIILPLTIVATILVNEAATIYNSFNTISSYITNATQQASYFLQHNPYLAQFNVDGTLVVQNFNKLGTQLINTIVVTATNIIQNSFAFLAFFLLMFYTLFFFIRDGKKMLQKMMYLCPLGDHYEVLLYKKFTATASATIRGTLLMGAIQGALGGILFAVCGIPSPVMWAVLMAVCSIIPVTGTFIVWLPAGLIMLFSGQLWQGVLILAFGTLVISTVDNLLRPVLVGKNLQMHPLLVLFSTLGGVIMFNISGFVIGPIIAALFLSFWEMYEEYYHKELSKD